MQVVILNHESAPGEVIAGLVHVDNFAELASNLVYDEQDLLLVGGELLLLVFREYNILLDFAKVELVRVDKESHSERKPQIEPSDE